MKGGDGSLFGRFRSAGAVMRRGRAGPADDGGGSSLAAPDSAGSTGLDLKAEIGQTAISFRGYDVANLGRTAEILNHPTYGPILADELAEASVVASDTLHRPVDLAGYVREGRPTALADFPLDVAMIVAVELGQLRILEEVFGVPVRRAKLSFGYSIGELSAMVLGGSFRLDEILPVPLALAEDCASLAPDTSMGILFTRAPVLPEEAVERLCAAVSAEGHGLVAPSAFLSPNTALLLGQGDTISRVEALKDRFLPPKVMLRRNPNKWPPLHTPLVREKNIPNRTAVAMYKIAGNRPAPMPPVLSCVTGKYCPDGANLRELLIQWTERPQRLWDAIDATLAAGVSTVIHVGPAPNLVPATFERLTTNVNKHLGNKYVRGMIRGMNRMSWLSTMLPHRAALLRAPFLHHVILEDWLLDVAAVPTVSAPAA